MPLDHLENLPKRCLLGKVNDFKKVYDDKMGNGVAKEETGRNSRKTSKNKLSVLFMKNINNYLQMYMKR